MRVKMGSCTNRLYARFLWHTDLHRNTYIHTYLHIYRRTYTYRSSAWPSYSNHLVLRRTDFPLHVQRHRQPRGAHPMLCFWILPRSAAVHKCGKNLRIGNRIDRRCVNNDIVISFGNLCDKGFHSIRRKQFGWIRRYGSGANDP